MNESKVVIGIAWYRREEYDLLRALAADPDSMGKTYDEWLAGVNRTMTDLRRQGMVVRRVDVAVRDLAAWCEERGCLLDGSARSEYAAEKVRAM